MFYFDTQFEMLVLLLLMPMPFSLLLLAPARVCLSYFAAHSPAALYFVVFILAPSVHCACLVPFFLLFNLGPHHVPLPVFLVGCCCFSPADVLLLFGSLAGHWALLSVLLCSFGCVPFSRPIYFH